MSYHTLKIEVRYLAMLVLKDVGLAITCWASLMGLCGTLRMACQWVLLKDPLCSNARNLTDVVRCSSMSLKHHPA